MPISTAPYKRTYKHTKQRGQEGRIRCAKCGQLVPKWKSFTIYTGLRIKDPVILKQIDKRMLHLMRRKMKVCPKCARFYHVVERGKSVRKKHLSR